MRKLITGVDVQGRSCVIEGAELGTGGGEVTLVPVFSTDEVPPRSRPSGTGADLDLGVPPGHTRWLVVHWPPGSEAHMHHTDTVDYDIVLAGSTHLILRDGEHYLETGDCVVITGVDHSWRTGPDGCVLSVTLLGSMPPR